MASKSRRNKVSFKWTKELIFLIVFIVGMITITVVLAIPSNAKRTLNKYNEAITAYNTEKSTSYSTIPSENVFEEISGGYDKQVSNLMSLVKESEYTYVFYGSLTNETFLEQMSNVNAIAQNYDVKKVYVFLANYVVDAETNGETSTSTYNNQIKAYNNILNEGRNADCKEFDMSSYPAFLVYKNGGLLFNTQVDEDNQYTWAQYLNKAFGIEKQESK